MIPVIRSFCHACTSLLMVITALLAGCSDQRAPSRRLLDAEQKPLDAESERLRRMQAVTVFNTATLKTEQITAQTLYLNGLADTCETLNGSACGFSQDCASKLCNARWELCIAKGFLALTKPQATPQRFGNWEVPVQSPSANVELAAWAAQFAALAGDDAGSALETASGHPRSAGDTCPAATAETAATSFKEAYDVYRAAVDQRIQSALDTSDAELSSSASPALAGERATVNWRLKQGGFAAGGTAEKLPFGANQGFCSTGTPSTKVRAAIAVIRDAAPPSNAITGSLSTSELLNGTTLAPPNGSIRQRLAQFRGQSELNSTSIVPKLEDYLNISLQDFETARKILKEEIAAFSRTEAVLPFRKLADGGVATIRSWAATASPATRLPAAYYGALARTNDTTLVTLQHPYQAGRSIYGGPNEGLNTDVEGFIGEAKYLLNITNDLPQSERDAASAPIGMMLAGSDNLGHLSEELDNEGNFALTVYGLDRDRARVALGEAALRCAVQGNVEGIPCSLSSSGSVQTDLPDGTYPLLTRLLASNDPHYGFDEPGYFSGTISAAAQERGWERFYVLVPKPSAGTTPQPGEYDAVIGVTVVAGKPKTLFSIMRGMEDRLAQLLEPARDTCSRPMLNCDGAQFDERIPLEDELTSDANNAESSWRHYLDLAKDAAAKADQLGADYIQAGLSDTEREESVEIRQQHQEQLANSFLQRVQSICGTEVDTHILLDKLKGAAGDKLQATSGTCATTGDCTAGHQGWQCLNGRCALDLGKVLSALSSSDPSIQRLGDCVSQTASTRFVSLGDVPLCLWRDTSNANILCRGAKPGQCPAILPAGKTCTQAMSLPASVSSANPPPAGTTQVTIEETLPLGFFAMADDAPTADEVEIWNDIAGGALAPENWPRYSTKIISSNVLDPLRIAAITERLNWEARFGGFSAITFDSVPIYQTGSAAGGPSPKTGPWPCGATDKPYPVYPTADLDCADPAHRDRANKILFSTLVAAKSMGSVSRSQTFDIATQFVRRPCEGGTPARELQRFYTGVGVVKSNYDSGSSYATTNNTIPPFDSCMSCVEHCFQPGFANASMSPFFGLPLAGLSRVFPVSGNLSNLAAYVAGQRSTPPDSLWVTNNVGAFGELTVIDYLSGLGIIAKQAGAAPAIDLSQPITITSVEDMEKAAQWVTTLAKAIRGAAGKSVFANMPNKVRDALRAESATGAYPQFGGEIAEALSFTRGALLRVRENGPLIANEVRQLGYDIREAKILIQKAANNNELAKIQLLSNLQNQINSCATAMAAIPSLDVVSALSKTGVAALTCANSLAQMDFARRIAEISTGQAALDNDQALIQFGAKFATRATALQTLSLHLSEAQEDLDTGLARLEKLRIEASGQVLNALYAASEQAMSQAALSRSIGSLYAGKQLRYEAALSNARRMAFLAKRAIEQRLGIRLADMTEELPLVDAPQTWEATACTFTGVNYAALSNTDAGGPRSYAAGFIGDYVDKLEKVVESYRLVNNFHEGTDTAVISLRDDIMNVRADCPVTGANLLYDAGQLDRTLEPGWDREGCLTTVVDNVTVPQTDCVDVTALDVAGPIFSDPKTSAVKGYTLTFGSGGTTDAAVVQSTILRPGSYRFTWYTKGALDAGGAASGQVWADSGVLTLGTTGPTSASASNWHRRFITFKVEKAGTVKVGFKKPLSGTVTVSAPMLERLPSSTATAQLGLLPFVNTGATLEQLQPSCSDTNGAVFRSTRWERTCEKLCPKGFGADCQGAQSKSQCYWQADFNVNQQDLQLGRILNYSGFARGNYNYRIDSIAINVVGVPRDCADSGAPQSCYGSGFVPYSLAHVGPFVVRNHQGDDVPAHVFDGNIEHARALATERYITNPFSEADRALLQQYTREELRGRPLDGTFVLKIWDEPGVDFGAIEDVQIILDYRYWTKSN
jgi:hypothetical protein